MGIFHGIYAKHTTSMFRTNRYTKNRITETNPAVEFGVYNAVITGSQMDPTDIYLELMLTQYPHTNQTIYSMLTMNHRDPYLNHLSARIVMQICDAVGVRFPSDSEQLHDIPLRVLVDNDGAFNRILEFRTA